MMAQGDACNIASNSLGQREKQSLLAMRALIERSLRQLEDEGGEGEVVGEAGEEKVEGDVDVDMML
jgi:hypothetical protein